MPNRPLTFSFLLFGVLGMLIGGCMWGTGESGRNALVHGFGLFFFALGCVMVAASGVLRLHRCHKDRRQRRQAAKKGLQGLENAIAIAAVATDEKSCDAEAPSGDPDLRLDVTSRETAVSTLERGDEAESRDPEAPTAERGDDDVSRDSGISTPKRT